MMYNADELLIMLRDIENLIHENTNADGSFRFDAERVFISLELALRMFDN